MYLCVCACAPACLHSYACIRVFAHSHVHVRVCVCARELIIYLEASPLVRLLARVFNCSCVCDVVRC